MKYNHIKKGIFLNRPNRFIAEVELEGEVVIVHVKNTGRCKELLISGCIVFLEENFDPKRKTKFDLISVYKGEHLINMDSQAPNKVFGEWVKEGHFVENVTFFKPESRYKNSRFDFYIESGERRIFVETKGVTLERNQKAFFPDAPTVRGVKHLKELIEATEEGYESYVVFLIQMDYITSFSPNDETHREFGDTLRLAKAKGVYILAFSCKVTEEELSIIEKIPIVL
ncbi:MAG: DNA/RNA nuclease SfsA [Eubacteriales bacterium]